MFGNGFGEESVQDWSVGQRCDRHPLFISLRPSLPLQVLCSVAENVKNFAVVYIVDIAEVPDFNTMYELYDPCTVMFFFRNKHIMIDLGTGNNNKINWALNSKQEMTDIIEVVYRGARKGRGLVVSPKDYSTKYRY
jgi:DIM1 family U5 snRNP protein